MPVSVRLLVFAGAILAALGFGAAIGAVAGPFENPTTTPPHVSHSK